MPSSIARKNASVSASGSTCTEPPLMIEFRYAIRWPLPRCSGVRCADASCGPIDRCAPTASAVMTICRCATGTIFGLPVEPEVDADVGPRRATRRAFERRRRAREREVERTGGSAIVGHECDLGQVEAPRRLPDRMRVVLRHEHRLRVHAREQFRVRVGRQRWRKRGERARHGQHGERTRVGDPVDGRAGDHVAARDAERLQDRARRVDALREHPPRHRIAAGRGEHRRVGLASRDREQVRDEVGRRRRGGAIGHRDPALRTAW